MHGIATAMVASMQRPREVQTLFVEHMALAFHAHAVLSFGGRSETRPYRGGLTSAQLRRVCDMMQAEIDRDHSITQLAKACELSPSHFARAFKQATGVTPHQWLTLRRVGRARELLARTRLDLTGIALACGFYDQSHFSRVFTRIEKISPGKWRRALAV
jgi:AraC family transcriptional regulator